MDWWLWVSIAFLLIITEMFIPTGFMLLLVGIAFLITGAVVSFGVEPLWLQIAICCVVLASLIFCFRKKIIEFFGASKVPGYTDFTNEEVVISSVIEPGQLGQGQLRGTQWSVRNAGTKSLNIGDRCRVKQVDGLVLEVE